MPVGQCSQAESGASATHPLDVPPLYTMASTWPVVRPKAIELPAAQQTEWHQDAGSTAVARNPMNPKVTDCSSMHLLLTGCTLQMTPSTRRHTRIAVLQC